MWLTGAFAAAALIGVSSLNHPSTAADKADNEGKQISFQKDIQPIFKQSCVRCHKQPDARGRGRGPDGGPGGPPGAGPGPGGGPGGGRGGPRGPAGGLRLDDKDAAMKGGKHGKAIVPGKADESLLYKLLKGPVEADGEEIDAMPKGRPGEDHKPLSDEKVELIKQWIDQGAKWSKS